MTSLFLVGGLGLLATVSAYQHSKSVRSVVQKHRGKIQYLPQAISMLVMTAQVSELVKAVDHISIVNVSAALLLLSITVATRKGTEGETH